MYAVIGRWTSEAAGAEDDRVRDLVLPPARPGLVAGYWSHDPETGRTHTIVVWESEAHARDFKSELDRRRCRAAQLGVINDFLVVTDVLAHAEGVQVPTGDQQ